MGCWAGEQPVCACCVQYRHRSLCSKAACILNNTKGCVDETKLVAPYCGWAETFAASSQPSLSLSSSSRWAASAPTASGGPSCRAADSWRAAASGTRWAWACPSGSSDTSPTRLCPGKWTASGTSTATRTAPLPGSSWPSPSLRWRHARWFQEFNLQFSLSFYSRSALVITLEPDCDDGISVTVASAKGSGFYLDVLWHMLHVKAMKHVSEKGAVCYWWSL